MTNEPMIFSVMPVRLSPAPFPSLTTPNGFSSCSAQIEDHDIISHTGTLLALSSACFRLAGLINPPEPTRDSPRSHIYAEIPRLNANTSAAVQRHETPLKDRRNVYGGNKTNEPNGDKTVTAPTAPRYMIIRSTTLTH